MTVVPSTEISHPTLLQFYVVSRAPISIPAFAGKVGDLSSPGRPCEDTYDGNDFSVDRTGLTIDVVQ
jgi:hypothetical protein